jgi:hypothetical protein
MGDFEPWVQAGYYVVRLLIAVKEYLTLRKALKRPNQK